MLDWLYPLIRQLPGLHRAEPIEFWTLGIAVVVATAIVLPLLRRIGVARLLATCSTVIWTVLCGMTMLLYVLGIMSSDFGSPHKRHVVRVTLPAYYVSGCLVIWGAYWLGRTVRRSGRYRPPPPRARGFPVIDPHTTGSRRDTR